MKKDKKKREHKSKPDVRLAWTFHPLRSNFREGLIVVLLGLLFSFVVYWNFKDTFLCVLSILIFLFSLNNFFFSTDYLLGEEYIEIKNIFYRQKFSWSRFRRYVRTRKGFFLSPYIKPCTMDNYRSIYLFCEGNTLMEVLNILKGKYG